MRYVCSLAVMLGLCASLPAKPPVPRPAKEFSCSDADGKKISLSAYKGKVVLIQFLITGCSHCQALSQVLTKLQAEYGRKAFRRSAWRSTTPHRIWCGVM